MVRPRWKFVSPDRKSLNVNEERFQLKYTKGKIVEAINDSFGIFCFKRKIDCERFILTSKYHFKMIKVKPLSRGKNIRKGYPCYCLEYFYKYNKTPTLLVPEGTICYQRVLVLD